MERDSVTFKILLRWQSLWHVWERGERHARFWWRNLKKSDHLEDLSIDWKLTLKCILKKYAKRAWNGLMWIGYSQVFVFI
jgi:hypothetical protein